MSFFALAVACGASPQKNRSGSRRGRTGPGGVLTQSTDVWTLGLRSRRALSFQTRKKNIREILKTNFRKY